MQQHDARKHGTVSTNILISPVWSFPLLFGIGSPPMVSPSMEKKIRNPISCCIRMRVDVL
jgi:hypothetical protein